MDFAPPSLPDVPLPAPPSAICTNLGKNAIRRRSILGFTFIGIGIVFMLWCINNNASDSIRFLSFIPFLLGYLGILQAKGKTCIFRAVQGAQEDEQGVRPLNDQPLLRRIRFKSMRIVMYSIGLAIIWTLLCLGIRKEIWWPESGNEPMPSNSLAPASPKVIPPPPATSDEAVK